MPLTAQPPNAASRSVSAATSSSRRTSCATYPRRCTGICSYSSGMSRWASDMRKAPSFGIGTATATMRWRMTATRSDCEAAVASTSAAPSTALSSSRHSMRPCASMSLSARIASARFILDRAES